jgi:hypothetical protein
VDAERVRDALSERLHDARGVEDHRDRDGEHKELHKPDDFPSEQEEQGDDPDDPKEQRPEKSSPVVLSDDGAAMISDWNDIGLLRLWGDHAWPGGGVRPS